ncbi:hypothetical protein BYT27DRAFT_7179482 [Phlegmacium glaucopus]|nr:hypothetical protein BYT27DRAFT_7179482 [Phlegmacium glaucopus]
MAWHTTSVPRTDAYDTVEWDLGGDHLTPMAQKVYLLRHYLNSTMREVGLQQFFAIDFWA